MLIMILIHVKVLLTRDKVTVTPLTYAAGASTFRLSTEQFRVVTQNDISGMTYFISDISITT